MSRRTRALSACLSLVTTLSIAACAFDTEDGGGTPSDDLGASADALTVCAKGSTTKGLDVSHWQGTINWPKVYADGYRFVIMKATEGTGYVDDTFKTNWANAKKAGLLRGAYHFFRPKYDGVAQAKHFVSTIGTLGANDIPPVLDLEVQDGVSDATVIARAKAFLETVEKLTGRRPMIYTGYFFTSLGSPSGFSKYPLWVAHWGVSCPNIPSGGWKAWTFWQYTDHASVSGIGGSVDANRFNGTLSDLKSFINPDQKVAGSFDDATCDTLAGWAWDPDTPSKALTVSIYADGDTKTGSLVTKVTADDKRSDLCTKIGSCNHGFSIALPDTMKDGKQHALRAYATGDQGGAVQLGGSPKNVTCEPPVSGTGGAGGGSGAGGSAGAAGAGGDAGAAGATGSGATAGSAGSSGSAGTGTGGSAGAGARQAAPASRAASRVTTRATGAAAVSGPVELGARLGPCCSRRPSASG